jgi:hypothetical protein
MNKSRTLIDEEFRSLIPPSAQNVTPDVSLQPELGVTTECAECGATFKSEGKHHLYCSGACRQRAYRKSPAHRVQLNGKKQQRMNRRNAWVASRVRDKAYGTFPQLSGPEPTFKYPLGALDLKRFSKVAS